MIQDVLLQRPLSPKRHRPVLSDEFLSGECVRQIRFRFSSHVNQIARVCDLSYEEVARMMDSV